MKKKPRKHVKKQTIRRKVKQVNTLPSAPVVNTLPQAPVNVGIALSDAELVAYQQLTGHAKPERDKIEKVLKQYYNIEADELCVLYPAEEDLARFYMQEVRRLGSLTDADAEADTAKIVLTDSDKKHLREVRQRTQAIEGKKTAKLKKAILAPESAAASQAEFEKTGKVTYSDFLKSLREGFA